MSAPYTSRVLYHLVGSKTPNNDAGNLDTLRSILQSMELRTNAVAGRRGGAILEIDPDRGCINGEPIAQTVVCFCDIPFEFLGLHASKYGRFGVGLDRGLVARWGGRPVVYIPTTTAPGAGLNNYFSRDVMNAWKGLSDFFPAPVESSRKLGAPPANAEEALHLLDSVITHLLAFTKSFDVDSFDSDPANFYMEREWRKLGRLDLHMPLKEVVAPAQYHELLQAEFPRLSHLRYREAPTVRGC